MYSRFGPIWLLLTVLLTSSTYVATSFQSECYALDKDGYLYDFTDLKGKEFHLTDQDGTYTIRFCKDVQLKTGKSIVNYGRFSPAHSSARDASNAFFQEYRYGDLQGCENEGYDDSGRGSTVSIMCDLCPSQCQDPDGCLCSAKSSPSNPCLASLILGLHCGNRGPQIYGGVSVGFSPRGKEVVDNGLAQWGYDYNANSDYSFVTLHSRVVLYLSAQSTLASKIGKPDFKVFPDKGLKVQISGTASNGVTGPTVLSPTVLEVNWQCEKKALTPYLVNVSIPVEGSTHAISFTLGKRCDYLNDVKRSGASGWATFGFLTFLLIVGLMIFCCAGFLYKTRIEDKHGLDALPGYSSFMSFMESSSHSNGYSPASDVTNTTNVPNSSSSNHSQRLPKSSDGPSYGAV